MVKQSQTWFINLSGNIRYQEFRVKYPKSCLSLSWPSHRKAASRNKKKAHSLQKLKIINYTSIPQSIFISKQPYSESAGTPFFSSKQKPQRQESIYPHCFSHYVVTLTWSKYDSIRRPSLNHPHLLKNENKGKKNKNLGILLQELKLTCFDQIVSLKVNWKLTTLSLKTIFQLSIGERQDAGQKFCLNPV